MKVLNINIIIVGDLNGIVYVFIYLVIILLFIFEIYFYLYIYNLNNKIILFFV